jgi:hypothetical protein
VGWIHTAQVWSSGGLFLKRWRTFRLYKVLGLYWRTEQLPVFNKDSSTELRSVRWSSVSARLISPYDFTVFRCPADRRLVPETAPNAMRLRTGFGQLMKSWHTSNCVHEPSVFSSTRYEGLASVCYVFFLQSPNEAFFVFSHTVLQLNTTAP